MNIKVIIYNSAVFFNKVVIYSTYPCLLKCNILLYMHKKRFQKNKFMGQPGERCHKIMKPINHQENTATPGITGVDFVS